MLARLRAFALALLLAAAGFAPGAAVAAGPGEGARYAASAGAESASTVARAVAVVDVFVRDGCPHCADAKVFLSRLAEQRPGLRVEYHPVDTDPQALEELVAISRAAGAWPPGVPTFVVDGRVMVGFDDAEHAGRELVALIDRASAPRDSVETRLFGTLSASRLGLPAFTLALGLLDGFNPCAMWVLLFLLSLLVRMRDRRRMAIVAGTFVLVSGLVYYAFMAAWLNLFLAIGMSDGIRVVLAATALVIGAVNLKDFVAFRQGPSLSIPESAKPGLYARMRRVMKAKALPAALLGVAALAVMVNFVELLCTAGLPAIYSAVLAQQQLEAAVHYAYLGLYIVGYIADDSLMVGAAVFALGSGKLTERGGRWLKLASGAVMLALGLVMLLRPQWLS
ncbi:glutaredoxin family protein [Burkholderiaceae bacterium FT117]|uniref:glutaredoxin family protein n=1 Tax=Zeimonas sediminis TaxID=2944268 RepID=UPI0023430952|nr:glutaredoxin family protein [Zeimonas sediminis]MCM5571566.1 glutaredoxin family protein [Zeimonas sediminis]